MKIYFLVAAFALTVTVAVAQRPAKQDYIVTTAGDTLRGQILVSGKGKTVQLRQAGGQPIKFGPTEARSYGDAAGVMGVVQTVGPHGTPRFVRPLVQGPVSLYGGENSQGKKSYFLQIPDTTYLVEIPPQTAHLTFHRLLSGCKTLQFTSNETQRRYPIRYTGLSRLVMDYNACTQPQRPSRLIRSAAGLRLTYGLKAGLNVSDFGLSFDTYPAEQKQATGYQGGIFLRASNKTPFSLLLEANYTFLRSTYGPANYANGVFSFSRTVSIQYVQAQLPLLVRYTFGNGSVKPFVNAGGLYAINLNNKSVETEKRTRPPFTETRRPITTPEDGGFGLTAGAGTTIHYASLPELSLEVRYDRVRYGNYVFFTPRHTSLHFDVSVGF